MGATFPLISPFSAGPLPVPSSTPRQWIAVSERFEQFDQNLRLTTRQLADGQTKIAGVAGCLNSHYYGIVSYTANALYVGSWGKGTMSRDRRQLFLHLNDNYSCRAGAGWMERHGDRRAFPN